uniref:Uncharacterized protein n=1 Tax=Oryza nivara TaxID=4536 RepID=A0A0E0GKN6_ORYNI
MSAVNIVDVSYVAVPATAALPPEPIKLTAMEALWLPFPVLQHVLFYEAAGLTPFDSVVDSLRSSLGATLATFAPLAGKLVHLEDTGDVAIACSASDAVRFVEAECDADVRRVAGDEAHDLRTFEQLVPELDMSKLPTSVLAVQATRLQGGLAVGVTLHHGVADGKSFWTFVEAWASACRCRGEAPAATPCFDRSVIKWPGGEEIARSVLRVRAGLACRGTQAFHPPDIHRGRAATRTPKAARITRDGEVHGKTLHRPPSSFVAVVAMASAFFARCKTTAADEDAGGDVFLFFFADVRERLDDPPVDAGYYFGACLTGCLARLPARDVHGDGALAAAASAIQEEILELAEDPLAGWNFMSLAGKIPSDRVMNVSGSPGFRPYDVGDFGWGKPRRTEPIRMNHDGQVAEDPLAGWDFLRLMETLVPVMERAMNVSGSPAFRPYDVGDFGWGKPRRTEPIRMNHDGQVALVRAKDGRAVQVSVSLLRSAHMQVQQGRGRMSAAVTVRVVGVSHVAVPAKAALPTEPMKLTATEALWLRIPLLQNVLFYESAGSSWPPFDGIVDSLRSSLGATLATFAPLAGRLVHLEDTGDVAIVCSASDAVRFVEAECDADVRSVAGGGGDAPDDDLRLLEQLAPELDMGELPTSVMAVQSTRLVGGVAVGVTVHHGVADGKSFWMFVEAWAASCRGETPAATPCFDRSVIKLPDGEALARSVLRKYTPNLPVVSPPSSGEESKWYSRRTFTVGAEQLERLKKPLTGSKKHFSTSERIVRDGEAHGARRPPSSFVALVATVWTLLVRSKSKTSAADDAEAFLFFFADFRERLDPPVDARYFGTCLTGCFVALPARDLLHGDGALAAAASAIQEEIRRMADDPLALWDFFSLNSRAA